MPSRERIRFVLIVTTAFLFGRFLSALVNPYELDPRLRSELERYKAIPEREVASSTLHGYDPGDQLHQRLGSEIPSSRLQPTVTAVILNWSRFPNVRLISSLLCGPWLDPVIAEVFVWNNNPKRLHTKDFAGTGCSRRKLRIYNSPANEYFQARFIACAQSSTPYCFIQDDDYLVASHVIHSLVHRLSLASHPHTIHLLPPHEHLTTSLREVHLKSVDPDRLSTIHTSPAWLGHGAALHRSEAIDFLQLLRHLNASIQEMKMADNYYTILGNRVPEIWFDQGIELGGGQPFTVGSEGDERNNRHMLRASDYLTDIVRITSIQTDTKLPYVFLGNQTNTYSNSAACGGLSCVFETTIAVLPPNLIHSALRASDMLSIGNRNLDTLGESGRNNYVDHPPSLAVDGDPGTYFQSLEDAKPGETIKLDLLSKVHGSLGSNLEIAWLVDVRTMHILGECVFSFSPDGSNWITVESRPVCQLANFKDDPSQVLDEDILECSIPLHSHTVQVVRVRSSGSNGVLRGRWKIYEMWLRQGVTPIFNL